MNKAALNRKNWLLDEVKANGLELAHIDTEVLNLSNGEFERVVDAIQYGSQDVPVMYRRGQYMVEVAHCDNEVDIYWYRYHEYVEKYGLEDEVTWEELR